MGKEGLVLALLGAGLVFYYWDEINAAIGSDDNAGGDGGNGSGGSGGGGGDSVVDPSIAGPPWNYGGAWNYSGAASVGSKAADSDVALEVKTLGNAESNTLNFWQWNHYYKMVTGFTGPDPIALLGIDQGDVQDTRFTFEQWYSLLQKAKGVSGLGRLLFPGAFADPVGRANIRPTGTELWRAGVR